MLEAARGPADRNSIGRVNPKINFFLKDQPFIEFIQITIKILDQTPITGFTAYTDTAPMSCCTADFPVPTTINYPTSLTA